MTTEYLGKNQKILWSSNSQAHIMEIENEASNSDNSSDGEELDMQTWQKS